ncbi:MAG: hypothetical protein PHE68_05615, partial [Candidatus Peribacteraceae bacterium]|nr:hypothetical protein [Candidatus Peribacteraceae bacterium]
STCLGLPVLDDSAEEVFGTIAGVLLHPDAGKVEGFFVQIPRFLRSEELFLPASDIVRWGLRVTVRNAEALAPPEEYLRVVPLIEDGRTILGQRIRTESGKELGRCKDVQWNTKTFSLEWLFPRRWFTWGLPIPVTEIAEVKRDAIIVRDPPATAKEPVPEKKSLLEVLPEIAEGVTRPTT